MIIDNYDNEEEGNNDANGGRGGYDMATYRMGGNHTT